MAHDKICDKLVALKVMASTPDGEADDEIRMHDELRTAMAKDDALSRLVLYQEAFEIKGGKDGQKVYRVLVLPLHGPNLDKCIREMPMSARMSAAKQLLHTLDHLHKKGIILRGQ